MQAMNEADIGENITDDVRETIEFRLKIERQRIAAKIERMTKLLEHKQKIVDGGETNLVAGSFHLGMVGGSGRKVRTLNRRRTRELERTIDTCVQIADTKETLGRLKVRLARIDDGTKYREAVHREVMRIAREQSRARQPADDLRRIIGEMSSGDHSYTFSDGARMCCYAGWDSIRQDSFAFVVLVDPNGRVYLERAASIQGVNIGSAGVRMAKRYLGDKARMLPSAIML